MDLERQGKKLREGKSNENLTNTVVRHNGQIG